MRLGESHPGLDSATGVAEPDQGRRREFVPDATPGLLGLEIVRGGIKEQEIDLKIQQAGHLARFRRLAYSHADSEATGQFVLECARLETLLYTNIRMDDALTTDLPP